MDALTIVELAKDTEREFRAAFGADRATATCETFFEESYRGGFRLVLADGDRRVDILYSDMELEVSVNGRQVFGTRVHAGFEGNMFSREHLREYLPRIAAGSASGV